MNPNPKDRVRRISRPQSLLDSTRPHSFRYPLSPETGRRRGTPEQRIAEDRSPKVGFQERSGTINALGTRFDDTAEVCGIRGAMPTYRSYFWRRLPGCRASELATGPDLCTSGASLCRRAFATGTSVNASRLLASNQTAGYDRCLETLGLLRSASKAPMRLMSCRTHRREENSP